MKKFAHQRPLGVAAAGMAALLLVGCGSGSGSAGTASSTAVLTGDSTGTASTTLSADDTSSTAPSPSGAAPAPPIAETELRLPNGEQIGTVDFAVDGSVITITATVNNLQPGFKGFHLHSIGRCEPNSADPNDPSKTGDFLSAGGHLGAADAAHPGHRGDLTSLQVPSSCTPGPTTSPTYRVVTHHPGPMQRPRRRATPATEPPAASCGRSTAKPAHPE